MATADRPIRTLVVDDEPPARDLLRIRLEREPDFEVVGEAADGAAAVAAVAAELPDLVFLDVQMPGMTGFQVLEAVAPSRLPDVVFVTAFDRFALRAFDVHALDYLVKPVDPERWRRTLAHVRAELRGGRLEHRLRLVGLLDHLHARGARDTGVPPAEAAPDAAPEAAPDAAEPLRRLVIRAGERIFLVRVGDVDWLEAATNYVRVYVGGRGHLVRMTLKSLERRLDPQQFVRIHRSTIVNLDRVAEIRPTPAGDHQVFLRDGRALRLSREFRPRLLP